MSFAYIAARYEIPAGYKDSVKQKNEREETRDVSGVLEKKEIVC